MTPGPVLFARYAYPPNALGYCGPDRADDLLERVSRQADDPDLRVLARGFEGDWPYLELIAHAAGIADPLDPQVVEAYWIGNHLLDHVDPQQLHASMEERFGPMVDQSQWTTMADGIPFDSVPTHAFHVFGIYPWVGLLRSGWVDEPLRVLDRCRIRWGRVGWMGDGNAVVRYRPLAWDGHELTLGPSEDEAVLYAAEGLSLVPRLAVGDWVALHWEWVCDRLTPTQLKALRDRTRHQLAAVNATRHPSPAAVPF
jgi:hypothetical protein